MRSKQNYNKTFPQNSINVLNKTRISVMFRCGSRIEEQSIENKKRTGIEALLTTATRLILPFYRTTHGSGTRASLDKAAYPHYRFPWMEQMWYQLAFLIHFLVVQRKAVCMVRHGTRCIAVARQQRLCKEIMIKTNARFQDYQHIQMYI